MANLHRHCVIPCGVRQGSKNLYKQRLREKRSLATATSEQALVNTPEATSGTAPIRSIRNAEPKVNPSQQENSGEIEKFSKREEGVAGRT